jgi:hypothetical protein
MISCKLYDIIHVVIRSNDIIYDIITIRTIDDINYDMIQNHMISYMVSYT